MQQHRSAPRGVLLTVSAAVAGISLAASTARAGVSFENIRHWVGEGANAVAVVLDWNRTEDEPSSFVWGYRWNGPPVNQTTVLTALIAADERLHGRLNSTVDGTFVAGFGYDANDNGGTFSFQNNSTSDPEDFIGADFYQYWASSRGAGAAFDEVNWVFCFSGADEEYLEHGDWTAHRYIRWGYPDGTFVNEHPFPEVATAAEPLMAREFDRIRFWVGEGDQEAVLVIDWSDDGAPDASWAWGYRWSSPAAPTLREMLRAIVAEDRRLHVLLGGTGDSILYALGYDTPAEGTFFRLRNASGTITAEASHPEALATGGWVNNGYWEVLKAAPAPRFDPDDFVSSWDGIEGTLVQDGAWLALRFFSYEWDWMADHPVQPPAPARSPYVWQVVEVHTDGAPFNQHADAGTVPGRPTVDTVAWGGQTQPIPVTPVIPAWRPTELLSLVNTAEWDGDAMIPGTEVVAFVTLEFDPPITDHPLNPYGVDFIVFGNTMQGYTSEAYATGMNDPATITFTGTGNAEPGLVEVSQDGVVWHAFADGPFADDVLPTMGRMYDLVNPDPTLFEGNLWWGRPSDPTFPMDPALTKTDLSGLTLAEVARRYNGSAGGTGFDIGGFDLAPDHRGRKWVRYVRITNLGTLDNNITTEVDAVSRVIPALPYDVWAREHYGWDVLPDAAVSGRSAPAANDVPNFLNAALGAAPDDPAPVPAVTGMRMLDGVLDVEFRCAAWTQDVRFGLVGTTHPADAPWTSVPATRGPAVADGVGGFVGTLSVPVGESDEPLLLRLSVGLYD